MGRAEVRRAVGTSQCSTENSGQDDSSGLHRPVSGEAVLARPRAKSTRARSAKSRGSAKTSSDVPRLARKRKAQGTDRLRLGSLLPCSFLFLSSERARSTDSAPLSSAPESLLGASSAIPWRCEAPDLLAPVPRSMEPVVYQETPLAEYLRDGGDGSDAEWAAGDSPPLRTPPSPSTLPSPPYSPSPIASFAPFAPSGRPLVKRRFRVHPPPALRPAEPHSASVLGAIRRKLWAALATSIDHSDNAKFLEQFRYTIIASQLLSGHSISSHRPLASGPAAPTVDDRDQLLLSTEGVIVPVLGALAIAALLSWLRGSGALSNMTRKRIVLVLSVLAVSAFLGRVHMRRQWLRYRREQTLSEMTALVSTSRDFDSATEATLSLVQEVELVSRGYRISAPLPPISRLEDRSQSRKCVRLRKVLKDSLGDALTKYIQASNVVKGFSEQTELEKYYDLYDVGDFDMSDALQGYCETEFEDPESVRSLKILTARFHTTRKMIFCALLALDANGEAIELLRWGAAYEALRGLNTTTKACYDRMRAMLSEEETFPVPPSPKGPMSPSRERWRSRWRKLDSLSTGIRGLQAKLHLLREESDRALDGSDDISQLGPHLTSQYESIGVDLRQLMAAWEEGKAALALGIDRNEKRLSSMSSVLSPTGSLSGLTTVDEGGDAADALKALTGESPPPSDSDMPEVLEAVARPRPRSLLTREERIVKMREDREQKAQARQQLDATRGMLRELESVISLRPRSRLSAPPLRGGRARDLARGGTYSAVYGLWTADEMLEARLEQANILKKLVDSIKDLVQDCNFDCNDSGIALQAMDNSHVALVSMMLKAEGFSPYRCDRNIPLGVNLASLTKVLRAAQNEDILTLKAQDAPDVLNLVFESSENDRISEYDLKLMDIDQEHLGIPDTEYAASITMPAAEFRRICTDLAAMSESVSIEASKDGIKFACNGDIGNGSVVLRSHTNVDKPELNIDIDLTEPVSLTFSLKYLVNFCKASTLSNTVKLCLSSEVPLLVEYNLSGSSYLRFYLAPKIGDEE
ncbi:hypothetical protein XA68_11918 [Ophiocordyceps unilateralis]|uniref:DNA sliding clamp PCNA n=1 Tax=Ophiocordyceps unilateralis TaxID=268505 RepID=A0A2A9PFU1_OPHUN|nr:hypothetical protein XA68_11918 [Ophiocordyceps unilateralis]